MPDFQFLHDALSNLWVIMAPRRQKRPNIAHSTEPTVCPFCVGREGEEEELFRIELPYGSSGGVTEAGAPRKVSAANNVNYALFGGGERQDPGDPNWAVRVLPNKFPFAPHHEVIVHSPDHHKNLDELPFEYVQLVLQAYKARFVAHEKEGKVYIFHNHGIEGGESLPHPHTQLVVVPPEVGMQIPVLGQIPEIRHETDYFSIFCPSVLQWPDEVWIAPRSASSGQAKSQGKGFGSITDAEIADLALALQRVIQLLDMRHGHEFPFNFYISPEKNWYLRIIPRIKRLGGFEVGTNVFVNTQDPKETIAFIKEHFENPDIEKIQREHRAEYATGV